MGLAVQLIAISLEEYKRPTTFEDAITFTKEQ